MAALSRCGYGTAIHGSECARAVGEQAVGAPAGGADAATEDSDAAVFSDEHARVLAKEAAILLRGGVAGRHHGHV